MGQKFAACFKLLSLSLSLFFFFFSRFLLSPLDSYVCGGAPDPPAFFSSLSEHDAPPALCGRTFGFGEPVFSCRECSQDGTCVMCSECFRHSAHRGHRYRMSTSEGDGGYCDCGDEEAFAKDAVCSRHRAMRAAQEGTSRQSLEGLPAEVRDRAEALLREVCRYCLRVCCRRPGRPGRPDDLLVGRVDRETFPDLNYCLQYANYCLVLLNDASHSVGEVVNVLRSSFESSRMSPRQAMDLTELVDREGRALLVVGEYKVCARTTQPIYGSQQLDRIKVDRQTRKKSDRQ